MTNQIGWYKMQDPSADYGDGIDDLRGIKCFWKKQVITTNLQGHLDILHKVKWNRLQNVVAVYDYYKKSTEEVVVFMEKCNYDLLTFNQHLKVKEQEKNLQFYQNLISQVSNGYLELKGLQILHRDIKPDNILVVKQNDSITYKICDFDISKKENEIQRLKTQNQKGTKNYSAPEIKESNYSYAADMFSFGLTIFQLLAGDNCLNRSIKKLGKLYDQLKQKNFKQILKESNITLSIDASESQKIINILNRMIVYQPDDRISWEDLNKNIYNLQEFERKIVSNPKNPPQKIQFEQKQQIQYKNFGQQKQQTLNHCPTTQNFMNNNNKINQFNSPIQQFKNLNINNHQIIIDNLHHQNQLNTTRERSNTLFDFDSFKQHLPQQNVNQNNFCYSAKKGEEIQNNQFQQKKLEDKFHNHQIHQKQPSVPQFLQQPLNNQRCVQLVKTLGQQQPNIQQQNPTFQNQNVVFQPHPQPQVQNINQPANHLMKGAQPQQFNQQFIQNKVHK